MVREDLVEDRPVLLSSSSMLTFTGGVRSGNSNRVLAGGVGLPAQLE
jgi:hypothetical protein